MKKSSPGKRNNMQKVTPVLRLRLIPVTMVMAMVMFGIKVGDVVEDGRSLLYAIRFSEATAAQDAFAEEGTGEKMEEEKNGDKVAEKSNGKPDDKDNAADGEKKKEADAGESDGDATEKISVGSDSGNKPEQVEISKDKNKRHFTQIEIDLLQSLSERREEIEEWEKELEMRATVLEATEQRIGDKILEMQGLKSEIEALMAQYNEREDAKIRSLVKIYESMKPKDAARIFEEVDMPILLLVVDRMAEKKVAPILAKMSAAKAKEVTMQLAEQRRLQKNVTDTAQALQNPRQ